MAASRSALRPRNIGVSSVIGICPGGSVSPQLCARRLLSLRWIISDPAKSSRTASRCAMAAVAAIAPSPERGSGLRPRAFSFDARVPEAPALAVVALAGSAGGADGHCCRRSRRDPADRYTAGILGLLKRKGRVRIVRVARIHSLYTSAITGVEGTRPFSKDAIERFAGSRSRFGRRICLRGDCARYGRPQQKNETCSLSSSQLTWLSPMRGRRIVRHYGPPGRTGCPLAADEPYAER